MNLNNQDFNDDELEKEIDEAIKKYVASRPSKLLIEMSDRIYMAIACANFILDRHYRKYGNSAFIDDYRGPNEKIIEYRDALIVLETLLDRIQEHREEEYEKQQLKMPGF